MCHAQNDTFVPELRKVTLTNDVINATTPATNATVSKPTTKPTTPTTPTKPATGSSSGTFVAKNKCKCYHDPISKYADV